MTASDFHGKPVVPDTVKHLDADTVVEVLSRHGVNVSDAADALGVASADLRRLLWARPQLMDAAAEIEERRLDLAEKNIYEALCSEDPRRRDAASMFTIRNSARAKRRGWITSASAGVEVNVQANENLVFHWRTTSAEVRDPEELARRRAIDDAREALAVAEGKRVVSIGWGNSDDGKTIEGDPVESDWAPPVYVSGSRDGSAAGETLVAEAGEPDPAPQPELPRYPGPGGPPPLVAHLYAPNVSDQRSASARKQT